MSNKGKSRAEGQLSRDAGQYVGVEVVSYRIYLLL